MKYNIIIACSKNWFFKERKIKKFLRQKNVYLFKNKKDLNLKKLEKINPKYIFFPHWSYKVEDNILKKFKCICFHTAPLPFGRGGSPIQNQIKLGFKRTKVCALKMEKILDAGPIYLTEKILLNGNLSEILKRISDKIYIMIKKILKKEPKLKKQKGKIYNFKRLGEKDNIINLKNNLSSVYDQIRMLDDLSYPNAYIKKGNCKIEFFNAKIKKNNIYVNAKIFKK